MNARSDRPCRAHLCLIAAALAAGGACEGDEASDAATGSIPIGALSAPAGGRGLAVVNNDYGSMSASISLVDRDTGVVRDKCFHSGSAAGGLSAPLSGDVVLPSSPQRGNLLVVIDRKQAVLTWVDPKSCAVIQQMNVGETFPANPYDVLDLQSKAYVLRYNVNPDLPSEGSDVLVIDPQAKAILGRIDLRPHVPTNAGQAILPQPSQALFHDGKVYVVLNAQTAKYDAAAAGRIVVIDPLTDTVTSTIELPGLENCGALATVPGDGKALLVGCNGLFSSANQTSASGIARVDLRTTPPAVTVTPASVFGRPVSGFELGAASETSAFTIVAGAYKAEPTDALWAFNPTTQAAIKVYEAPSSFVLGLFLDVAKRRLYLSEATDAAPKLHVFSVDDAGVATKTTSIVTSPETGLPPHGVALY